MKRLLSILWCCWLWKFHGWKRKAAELVSMMYGWGLDVKQWKLILAYLLFIAFFHTPLCAWAVSGKE